MVTNLKTRFTEVTQSRGVASIRACKHCLYTLENKEK